MTFAEARRWVTRRANVLFFVGGFLFDALTLQRIDSVLDLAIQFLYLGAVAWLVLQQAKVDRGLWQPEGRIAQLWRHNVEALHFIYGALLSAYVIFYLKSSTFSRSFVFLLIVIVLMFVNEMPQLRQRGYRMRVGLYAFCVLSYLNYLLPVLIGRMGAWVFILALTLSIGAIAVLIKRLARMETEPEKAQRRLAAAPAFVLILIAALYFLKWIPPVPLSMQYAGIYHGVVRQGDHYELTHRKWPWYQFWRGDDRPFLALPGDAIHCFVRVFGPRGFREQIYLHWKFRADDRKPYATADRIPLSIYGGRGKGFRGYSAKGNYQPGDWRVDVETSDGRTLGGVDFVVRTEHDPQRELKIRSM